MLNGLPLSLDDGVVFPAFSFRVGDGGHIHADEVQERKTVSNTVLGCPRKLGSMVSKWVISPTYKWGILGL